MMMMQSDEESSREEDGVMRLEPEDESEESDLAYMCAPDLKDVEISLAKNAFMHGHYSFVISFSPRATINNLTTAPFNGIITDTAANRSSIMSMS